jgi:hypothetical protein
LSEVNGQRDSSEFKPIMLDCHSDSDFFNNDSDFAQPLKLRSFAAYPDHSALDALDSDPEEGFMS